MTGCYFQGFTDTPCYGRLDRCHFIPQRVLRREHRLANPRVPPAWFKPSKLTGTDIHTILRDERNTRPGCRSHHHKADQLFLQYLFPNSVKDFAADYGLERFIEKEEGKG